MEFSRPEYWSGWLIPSPGDLPDPGIEPGSPALQADSLLTALSGKPCFWGRSSQGGLVAAETNGKPRVTQKPREESPSPRRDYSPLSIVTESWSHLRARK